MPVVEVERDSSASWIWLNRPDRLNAIDDELGCALLDVVERAAADEDVRVIVLAGRGRAFCAGDDLRGPSRDRSAVHARRRDDYLFGVGRWPKVSKALVAAPKPTVAMLQGHAHGAGWDIALSCDFRIGGQDLQVSHAYVRRGLASGISRLPAYVGIGVASDLLMRGARLGSEEAHRLGLLTKVVPDERLEQETKAFAHELAVAPTVAVGLLKEALSMAYTPGHDQRMWLQASIAADSLATEDAAEGREAFAAKRDPVFRGR